MSPPQSNSFLKLLHFAMQFLPSSANIDENVNAVKSTENVALSEEVNGTPEYNDEGEQDSTFRNDDEEEDDEDDGDVDDYNPGEASVPKRLWKFFTS